MWLDLCFRLVFTFSDLVSVVTYIGYWSFILEDNNEYTKKLIECSCETTDSTQKVKEAEYLASNYYQVTVELVGNGQMHIVSEIV